MEIAFFPKAMQDLDFWKRSGNKQVQKRISELLKNIQKTPFEGLGQPEALKYELSGMWSRRINREHRIVYEVLENIINLYSLHGHY